MVSRSDALGETTSVNDSCWFPPIGSVRAEDNRLPKACEKPMRTVENRVAAAGLLCYLFTHTELRCVANKLVWTWIHVSLLCSINASVLQFPRDAHLHSSCTEELSLTSHVHFFCEWIYKKEMNCLFVLCLQTRSPENCPLGNKSTDWYWWMKTGCDQLVARWLLPFPLHCDTAGEGFSAVRWNSGSDRSPSQLSFFTSSSSTV